MNNDGNNFNDNDMPEGDINPMPRSDFKAGIMTFGQVDNQNMSKNLNLNLNALPVLPTRDMVLFPGIIVPITLGRESSIAIAQYAEQNSAAIAVVCQTHPEDDSPSGKADLYEYGVVARVMKVFELPDGSHTAIVHAADKIKVLDDASFAPMPGILAIKAKPIKDHMPAPNDKEFSCVIAEIRSLTINLLKRTGGERSDLMINLESFSTAPETINFIATTSPISVDDKEKMLRMIRLKDRAFTLLSLLSVQDQIAALTDEIRERTHESLSKMQRETFLSHQLDAIRAELYGSEDDEIQSLKKRAMEMDWPSDVAAIFNREWNKLDRLSPHSPEYSVSVAYLELLLELPWNKLDPVSTDLKGAREILEADHYGLEKVKERILEQLAIMMNTPQGRSPILCLVGAPGVGKTSLGQSIARALGRKYQRVSLGGLHDEAELRGHRRTYIGSMPGRIIDAIRRAGSANPVILLDEIDKTATDFHGDPQAALLEILDPEQNCRFHDNYVDADFDLSKALFIATANSLATISQPLLDRMEIIDISGYLPEEKTEIARRHLLTRLRAENALSNEEMELTPEAIGAIIEGYTSESGVRQLEKKLAAIARKVVMAKVEGREWPHTIVPSHLRQLLGVETFSADRYEGNDYPGVVTGLAWTSAGGQILYIEASATLAKGDKLTLTGNLGDVMKESAMIALQWARANAPALGIDPALMEHLALHLHVPEGAIPKDGPSAGITMATAIVSALTRRKVRPRIAMTGEITLRGRVLPVGGIKEKILAAKRAGATHIILCAQNRKDIEEIPEQYLKGLEFHYVKDALEVIAAALSDETVGEPLKVSADKDK
ncbi:MAG: endopeptidase La [Pseudoflavonifractor sp.]|nr:endopeptidase La [Alloprevotella sp.]MCM1116753.1 endopeptidase La [Pseudoflavonifractor sp.]